MQLWLYTPYEHIPCGVIDSYSGLGISHRAIKPGAIEFECPLNDTTKLIRTDALLWPQGDDTAFIVTTCEKHTETNGEEVITVRGACLKWLLNQRVLALAKVFQGKSGAVMNQMLTELFADSRRAFPRFMWQIDNALGDDITMEATADAYLTTFQAICEASSLTMQVLFHSTDRTMVLTVSAGHDRSVGNTAGNIPILFDETLETIQNIEYTESIADSKNVMYISDSDDAVLEVGETASTGFQRFEDCTSDSGGKEVTNPDGSTTTLTDDQYRQKKIEAAQKELDKARPVKSATGDLPGSEQLLAYGEDYTLGDVVTVRKPSWAMDVSVRITEEARQQKNGVLPRKLTIGSPLPTIAERIKMR